MAISTTSLRGPSLLPLPLESLIANSRFFFPRILSLPSSVSHKFSLREAATSPQFIKPAKAQNKRDIDVVTELALLPRSFAEVLANLQNIPDVRTRCHRVMRYGEQLASLDPQYKIPENEIRRGLSTRHRAWVRAYADPDNAKLIRFHADSEAPHIKGLAAILVVGFSGTPVETIARMPIASFELLIGQSLLPAKWSSQFLVLLEHMQRKALELSRGKTDGGRGIDNVLNIMGLDEDEYMKDEIDKTHVVHEMLNAIGCGMNNHEEEVYLDRVDVDNYEKKKYYEEDAIDADGLSWRVKRIPPSSGCMMPEMLPVDT